MWPAMADAPPPSLPSAEDAVPGWASAGWAEFLTVRKNRDACIHWLLRLSQRIEAAWACEAERRAGLRLLRECLQSLGDHAHADCRWLAGLAPRMLASLDIDERHFLNLMLPIERKWSRGLRDEEFLVTTDDRRMESVAGGSSTSGAGADGEATAGASQLPLVLVLDHLRSAFNVGSIFRTADCLGVSRLYLCGYTATPDDAQVVRTSMGAHAHVAWEWRQHTWQAIDELKAAGMSLIGLETSSRAPFAHEFSFPRSGCALLLGNERCGRNSRATLSRGMSACQHAVYSLYVLARSVGVLWAYCCNLLIIASAPGRAGTASPRSSSGGATRWCACRAAASRTR